MRTKILEFLYKQVQDKKIPQIRGGMVEEFEAFIEGLLAEREAVTMAERMAVKAKSVTVPEEDEII